MEWILENKEWIFSGIGLAISGFLYRIFFIKKENGQKIDSGDNSTNVQGGRNVTVSIGEKSDER